MAIKQVNGKYQATFRDQNRKEIQKTFRLKSEAEDWIAEQKQRVKRGNFIRDSKETITDRCDGWIKRKKAINGYRFGTLQNYETHIEKYIKPALGAKRVQWLTIKDCEEAALKWVERTSDNTANMAL